MKITVVKEFTFEAAHYLPGHEGRCQHLHGHSYRLQVGVKDEPALLDGMVIDFSDLKEVVERHVVNKLDHNYLNESGIPFFPSDMPTAENMVRWIVKELESFWPTLSFVRLYETPTSYAEWRSERRAER